MRSQGGRDTYSNLITLCTECHTWVHAHPMKAGVMGLLLQAGRHPEAISVAHFCWPGRNIFLRDDGTINFWSNNGHTADPDDSGFFPAPRR